MLNNFGYHFGVQVLNEGVPSAKPQLIFEKLPYSPSELLLI